MYNKELKHATAAGANRIARRHSERLLDLVRDVIRRKHHSIHTEEVYVRWIKRFILYPDRRRPRETEAAEIEEYLTYLAVERNVAASARSQARSAILLLHWVVLKPNLDRPIDAVRD